MFMDDSYSADGSVLARVDVLGEALVLACVNDQCPLVISSEFAEWKRHVLCLECLFVLGRPDNEIWILAGGAGSGGAPPDTNRVQILDDRNEILIDLDVSPHGWLIPMPSNLNWDSFYVRYLADDTELLRSGPDGHVTPYMDEDRDGKYPDRSSGGTGYAPLSVSDDDEMAAQDPWDWESGYDVDLPDSEGGGWRSSSV